jgi:hypothetical protein
VHELGRARKPGTDDRKLEKDVEGRGTSRGGGRYLWSSRKQRGLRTRAFPDRAAAKPGGSNSTTEITTFNKRTANCVTNSVNRGMRRT